MTHLYHAQIEVATHEHMHMTSTQMTEFEKHCKRRLASEFLPFIEQNMQVSKISTNTNMHCDVFRGSMVMMPLEEYRRMASAASQVDYRYRGLGSYHFEPASQYRVPKPKPKQEFDAVDYLKNLMKTPR